MSIWNNWETQKSGYWCSQKVVKVDGLSIYLLVTLSLLVSAAAFNLPNFSGRGQQLRYGQFWCTFKFDLRRSFWREIRTVPDSDGDQSNLRSNGILSCYFLLVVFLFIGNPSYLMYGRIGLYCSWLWLILFIDRDKQRIIFSTGRGVVSGQFWSLR